MLPESKTFRFKISDSPNVNNIELLNYFNCFCESMFFKIGLTPCASRKESKITLKSPPKTIYIFKYHQHSEIFDLI